MKHVKELDTHRKVNQNVNVEYTRSTRMSSAIPMKRNTIISQETSLHQNGKSHITTGMKARITSASWENDQYYTDSWNWNMSQSS